MAEALPESFRSSIEQHFGSDVASRVLNALSAPPSVSIRTHPLKQLPAPIRSIAVPWSERGYILPDRPNFALDPLFHAGGYYVQDSSSMILEEVLRYISAPTSGVYLDACAAPGGKSTILLDHIGNDGFLVANEVHPQRNAVLRENLLKWGNPNHGVTALSTDKIGASAARFDVILIDAPCSGEGMFRKDDFAQEQWSPKLVDQCSTTQSQILHDLKESVVEGGYLIYATCTMNAQENEAQLRSFVEQNDFAFAVPDLSRFEEWLLPVSVEGHLAGYYLLPGISTGEGLFISVLKRTGSNPAGIDSILHRTEAIDGAFTEAFPEWLGKGMRDWEWNGVHHIVGNADKAPELFYKRLGLPAYELKGSNVIPHHGLAMWPSKTEAIELDQETALRYLRKESISLPREIEKGWHLVSYRGMALGWVKALEQRTNNYYPNGLRLRI